MYVCMVCSLGRPPLLPLAVEHRQLLEALVSPLITTMDLDAHHLLLCTDCQMKMLSIHHFQKMALNGLRNLKYWLWNMSHAPTNTHTQDSHIMKTSTQRNNKRNSPVRLENQQTAMEPIRLEPEMRSPEFIAVPALSQPNPLAELHLKSEPNPTATPDVPLEASYLESDFELEYGPEFESGLQTELKPKPELQSDDLKLESQCDSETMKSDCEPTRLEQNLNTHTQIESTSDSHYIYEPNKEQSINRPIKQNTNENIAEAANITREGQESCTITTLAKVANAANTATEARAAAAAIAPKKKRIRLNRNRKKPEKAACPDCDRVFYNLSYLRLQHYHMVHAERKPVKCDKCGKQCRNEGVLKFHTCGRSKKVVEPNPEFFCEECCVQFPTKTSYKAHRMSLKHTPVELLKFECKECSRRYRIESKLRDHVDAVHRRLKKFKCDECSEAYIYRRHLKRHAARAHGGAGAARLECELCGKSFTVKKSLAEHLYWHAGRRPYRCARCPADFCYSAALYTHTRLKHLHYKKKQGKKGERDKQTDKKLTA